MVKQALTVDLSGAVIKSHSRRKKLFSVTCSVLTLNTVNIGGKCQLIIENKQDIFTLTSERERQKQILVS